MHETELEVFRLDYRSVTQVKYQENGFAQAEFNHSQEVTKSKGI